MKRKNPIHAYKRLLAHDHNWDYAYLIALEKKKLQRMWELKNLVYVKTFLANDEIELKPSYAITLRLADGSEALITFGINNLFQ